MARAQAAAAGLTEDAVEDEIAACRRERRMRRMASQGAGGCLLGANVRGFRDEAFAALKSAIGTG